MIMIRIIIIYSNDNSNPLSKPHRGWFLDIVQRRSRCFQIVPLLVQDWPAIVLIIADFVIIIVILILMPKGYSFNLEKNIGTSNLFTVQPLAQVWPALLKIITVTVV